MPFEGAPLWQVLNFEILDRLDFVLNNELSK